MKPPPDDLLYADRALALRLERAEVLDALACAEARQLRAPASPVACATIAGGAALFFGAGAPLTQAVGLGMEREVTAAELDALVAFFHDRGAAAQVRPCPLAHPSLFARLGERGFRLRDFINSLARRLPAGFDAAIPAGVEVAQTDDSAAWAELATRGFELPAEQQAAVRDVSHALAEIPGCTRWVARVAASDAPVGAALLTVREGVAQLFATSTLPSHRGRGVQSALIRARLTHAAAQGAELARSTAVPAGPSQRNLERHGFRVVYTRPTLVLPR
jgi:GNAT superfamily N-acetyltransferase